MTRLRARTIRLITPADIQGQITERRERRYLVDTQLATRIAKALKGNEDRQHPTYSVTTTYLIAPSGTRYRLRQYDGEGTLQLESKSRDTEGRTLKCRFKLTSDPPKAIYEGTSSYERQAFMVNGIRVTVDRNVQTTGRTLDAVVVEVKGPSVPKQIAAMLPEEDVVFGKRRWVLG